MKTKARF